MNKKVIIVLCLVFCVFFWLAPPGKAENLKAIPLVKPQMDSGRLLMHVLKERRSSRDFSNKKLPIRVLSNLLWSACGINRPGIGKRTAPSAMNWQEVDVYVAMAQGLYLYDYRQHKLEPILGQDIRALTGTQTFVSDAPVNLVYVADLARMGGYAQPESKDFYAAVDTGFIAQNVNLYCASEGLATVVRGMIDREHLAQAMKLRPEQKIMLAQTVGYPRK
jgi:nitroreductase